MIYTVKIKGDSWQIAADSQREAIKKAQDIEQTIYEKDLLDPQVRAAYEIQEKGVQDGKV